METRYSFIKTYFLIAIFLLGHSAESEAQWTSNKGEGWIDLATYYHDTKSQFWFDGRKIKLFEEGHIVTSAIFLTGSYGLANGLDAWVQIPFIRSRFDDIVGNRTSQGLGDPRFYLRADPKLLGLQTIPIALRVGLKAPVGSFQTDAEIVPLGEGQVDLEAILELGYAKPTGNLYTIFWLGYRWRFENEESLFTPGNELFSLLKVGANYGKFSLDGSLEFLDGASPVSQGLVIPSGRKEIIQFTPRVGYNFEIAVFNLGLRFPIRGRNFASGPSLAASIFIPIAF